MKNKLIVAIVLLFSSSLFANSVPTGMVYHGRIVKPNGFPLENASVTFTLTLYDPAKSCILREEAFNLDMSDTDGVFSLGLGSGAPTVNDPGNLFSDVFRNDLASLDCGPGGPGTIDMDPGDTRRLQVRFDDTTEVVTISPDHFVRTVPYALIANSVQGLGRDDILQVNSGDNVTQSNLEDLFTGANYATLTDIVAGNSSVYAKISDLPVSGGSLDMTAIGKDIIVRDTPTSGDSAVNKDYVDGLIASGTTPTGTAGGDLAGSYPNPSVDAIQGDAVSATNPNNGEALVWTGGASYVPTPILPLAGGTMTGSINMGTNNISNGGTFTAATLAGTAGSIGSLTVSGVSTFTGIATFDDVIDMDANRITDVGAPSASTDAATKGYVDGLVGTGTIATTNIADDAVTYAKIQDVTATNRLLGRASGGAGIVEEITLGTGLSYTGTTLNVTVPADAVGASQISTGAVGADEIAADAVGSSELADNAVDTNAIQANAVTVAKMQTVATDTLLGRDSAGVGNLEVITLGTGLSMSGGALSVSLAADSVGASQISTGAVGADEIAADAVGSSELADNAVDTNAIQADAVTYAKIQDVTATNRLLGRASGGSGIIEEITLGTGLSYTGTTLNVSVVADSVGSSQIAADAVGSSELADNAVDTNAIQANAVTVAKMQTVATDTILGRDSAGAGNLEVITLGTGLSMSGGALNVSLSADSVGASQISTGAVGADEIAADAVGSSELADNAVDTNAIQANAVTVAKMQTVATDTLLGRDSAGAGNLEVITLGTGLSMSGGALSVSLAADSVGASQISTGAVGADEIAADAVGSSELADNAVDTNAIQANAVTSAKLATAVSQNLWTGDGTDVWRTSGEVGIGTAGAPTEKLEVNGNILATAFISTSDARLKKNVKTISGLEVIEKLRGVRFDWIENNQSEIGFIAQEVEAVLPELVVTDPESGIKAVKYSNMVAPLIESVKDVANMSRATDAQLKELKSIVANHSKKIQEHDRRIASLEDRVKSLEEMNKALLEELRNKSK